MLLFDFRCRECGTKFEDLVKSDEHTTACKSCGGLSDRLISAVRAKLDPISGDFPGATLKWERLHEEAGRKGKL